MQNGYFKDKCIYLNDDPPDSLHGHGDEGDDSIRQCQVEDEVVDIGPAHQIYSGSGGGGLDKIGGPLELARFRF